MNGQVSDDEEARIDAMIERFATRIEHDVDEIRRQLEAEIEAEEVRMIEMWWKS